MMIVRDLKTDLRFSFKFVQCQIAGPVGVIG